MQLHEHPGSPPGAVIDWLNCAKKWGLTISYLGGWNESEGTNTGRPGSYTWYSDLRAALHAAGYQKVQLIAGDLNPTWEYASSNKRSGTMSRKG